MTKRLPTLGNQVPIRCLISFLRRGRKNNKRFRETSKNLRPWRQGAKATPYNLTQPNLRSQLTNRRSLNYHLLAFRKREMQHLAFEKVKNYLWKTGFVDYEWPNLNAPSSYTPSWHSLLGSIAGCPFSMHSGNENAACGLLIKWKSI